VAGRSMQRCPARPGRQASVRLRLWGSLYSISSYPHTFLIHKPLPINNLSGSALQNPQNRHLPYLSSQSSSSPLTISFSFTTLITIPIHPFPSTNQTPEPCPRGPAGPRPVGFTEGECPPAHEHRIVHQRIPHTNQPRTTHTHPHNLYPSPTHTTLTRPNTYH